MHQPTKQNAANNENNSVFEAEQRDAIAVAIATAKAAEAAVATAQAAVEVARLVGPPPSYYAREKRAATVIQTSFRGYLVSNNIVSFICVSFYGIRICSVC